MKGVIHAGEPDTGLAPVTDAVAGQLLPVYDKPLIYYPLSMLMLAGIRDILIVATPSDLPRLRRLLDTGAELGIRLRYARGDRTGGLAETLLAAEWFLGTDPVAIVRGDSIGHGPRLGERIAAAARALDGCVLFCRTVRSGSAATGLALYDGGLLAVADRLRRRTRGGVALTDINQDYAARGKARLLDLGRGYAWLDAHSHGSLLAAAQFVQILQRRQGVRIGCVEEIAMRMGYISTGECSALGAKLAKSDYGRYVMDVAERSGS